MSTNAARVSPRHLSQTLRQIGLGLTLACASLASAVAATPVLTATQLNIYRDGTSADWLLGNNRLLADGFDNGDPLVGPAFSSTGLASSYVLSGLQAGASAAQAVREQDSTLLLDPSYGAISPNASGQTGRSLRLRLLTNISDPNAGLPQARSFAATLRLSLAALPAPGQSFGLRLTDGFSNGNDYIELYVGDSGAGDRIVLRRQDFVTGAISVVGNVALTPVTGASLLVLSLTHATPGSDVISGSYNFADASGALLSPNFVGLGTTTAFHGEVHTQVELRATLSAAVPEPAAGLLMAGGLALLGWQARRRG